MVVTGAAVDVIPPSVVEMLSVGNAPGIVLMIDWMTVAVSSAGIVDWSWLGVDWTTALVLWLPTHVYVTVNFVVDRNSVAQLLSRAMSITVCSFTLIVLAIIGFEMHSPLKYVSKSPTSVPLAGERLQVPDDKVAWILLMLI